MKGRSRTRALQALCIAAFVLLVTAAPAVAQVGVLDPVGGSGGSGGSSSGSGGSSGGGLGGAIGDTVGGVTGGGGGNGSGSGGTGGTSDGGSTGTVGGAVGGAIDGTVDGVTGGGGGNGSGSGDGGSLGDAVGNVIDHPTGSGSGGGSGEHSGLLGNLGLGQATDDTRNFIGSGLGGGLDNPVIGDSNCKCQLGHNPKHSGGGVRFASTNGHSTTQAVQSATRTALIDRLARSAEKAAPGKDALAYPGASSGHEVPSARPILERIAQAAAETAQKLAFPLTLTLIVFGFVMVQGRIDRKDPKLALAAVDSDETLLSFQ